ncbi:MAG: hydantoinase/oxoprolinase family protein, partial [Firmicutes bacterium]|nr:hydantoinase/oxoprolinase family protein [Bacillota bacterium]
IVNHNMANAIQSRTVQKGLDPRRFGLLAFGGAGGLCAVEVARILQIPEVVMPVYPGITSAIGLTTTSLRYDALKTEFMAPDSIDCDRLNRDFQTLEAGLTDRLQEDGVAEENRTFEWAIDCRYKGQGYELRVAVDRGTQWDAPAIAGLYRQFHERHRREYGHAFAGGEVEIVNIRVVGLGKLPTLDTMPYAGTDPIDRTIIGEQSVQFFQDQRLHTVMTPLLDRLRLAPGSRIDGPAIFVQQDATTILPPGAQAVVHSSGNLLISVGGGTLA